MNGSIVSLRDVLEGFVVVLWALRAERWDESRRNVLEVGLGVIGAAPPETNARIRGQIKSAGDPTNRTTKDKAEHTSE